MKSLSRRLPRALLPLLVLLPGILGAADYASPYTFTTLAGLSSVGSDDGPGNVARFYAPSALTIDGAGNLYVTDETNNLIRKITPAGVVSTIAGSAGQRGSTDGTGSAALFGNPQGIAVDGAGYLYVTDKLNSTVRKISPAGAVTTLAGSPGQPGSADGTGSEARFYILGGIALDRSGNVYVADWGNQTVRKISPAGVVTTFAGQANVYGQADGPGLAASFIFPFGLAIDAAGTLWVTELGGAVRSISPEGMVTTVIPSSAGLQSVESIAAADDGTLYLTDIKQVVRRRTVGGVVQVFAGSEGNRGAVDGSPTEASFSSPFGLALDHLTGNLYVADRDNNTIRKITPAGVVTTFAGLAPAYATGSADGSGHAARFNSLAGTAVGPAGEVYVADTINSTIRRIAPDGTVSTFAGKAGTPGATDGPADQALLDSPYGLAVSVTGTIFVTDAVRNTVRQITPQGVVTTLAGDPVALPGGADGSGDASRFNSPEGIALDGSGNLYVADRNNFTIRKITPAGVVTTFAGSSGTSGTADGTGSNARLEAPEGVAADAAGNVYVANAVRHGSIRKISPAGAVITLAGGVGGDDDSTDGAGTAARFNNPHALAVDQAGNVYVADGENDTIRKVTPAGIVTTLAGLAAAPGNADGTGSKSRFFRPFGIGANAEGTLFVTSGTTVRKGLLAVAPVITTQPASQAVSAGASVQFAVSVGGVPDPTYQWYFNGITFGGATGPALSFTNARTSDAGDYTVVVTNALGSVTSNKATLAVTTAPSASVTPPLTQPAGGGGGAPSLWFLPTLLTLSLGRWLALRRAGRRA